MMRPGTPIDPQDLPRSRYEQSEESEARPIARITFGLLLANALLLVKDMLFGKTPDAKALESEPETARAFVRPLDDPEQGDTAQPASTPPDVDKFADSPLSFDAPRLGLGLHSATEAASREVPVNRMAFHGSSALDATRAPSNDNEPEQPLAFARSSGSVADAADEGGAPANPYAPPNATEDDDDDDGEINRAPAISARVTLSDMLLTQTIIIGSLDLLRFASDPDGDHLGVLGLSATSGTIVRMSDGRWQYTASQGHAGEVVFTYQVTDGEALVPQYALLRVLDEEPASSASPAASAIGSSGPVASPAARLASIELPAPAPLPADGGPQMTIIVGTDGDDVLVGTEGDDLILAGAGDDTIIAATGNDAIDAGAGDDTIVAQSGDGDDIIDGGDDTDTLDMSSIDADVTVDLDAATARSVDTGNDVVTNIENVVTGSGDDTVTGSDDANVIDTGAGNDTVTAAAGADAIDAGTGDDTIVAEAGDGNDIIDGGGGTDTLDMSTIDADVTVDLDAATARSADTGNDTVTNIENIVTGSGDDTVTGSDDANIIDTGAGDDAVTAAAGADVIDAGAGDDTIVAQSGDGDDIIDGGGGTDTLDMSTIDADVTVDLDAGTANSHDTGNDVVTNVENVVTGSGDDTIVANDAVNEFSGGTGNDVFVFTSSYAAGNGDGSRDRILDFDVGDRIDIDEISREFADEFGDILSDEGIRRFVLMRDNADFSEPGQLRIIYQEFDDGTSATIIEGNIDHDADTDFQIELTGRHDIGDDQFCHRD
jgi:Ca2+-binding RTX toxin-like protein